MHQSEKGQIGIIVILIVVVILILAYILVSCFGPRPVPTPIPTYTPMITTEVPVTETPVTPTLTPVVTESPTVIPTTPIPITETPTPTVSPTPTPLILTVNTRYDKGWLHFRYGPSLRFLPQWSKGLGAVQEGWKLTFLSCATNTQYPWVNVTYKSFVGWVYGAFVTPNPCLK